MMWKHLPLFDARFLINTEGKVYNSVTENYLTPSVFQNGYKTITFNCNGVRQKISLHRLLANSFIPNPNNLPVVMHRDNNKLNCELSNLKWGTYSENNSQAIRDGLNTIPRPDNRKYFNLYNENCPVSFNLLGIKSIMEKTEINNSSRLFNYMRRKTSITSGPFKDWKIDHI